jgi:DNA-binding NarL/FixJ family response regulator
METRVQWSATQMTDVVKPRLLLVDHDRRFCRIATSLLEDDFELRVVHTAQSARDAAARPLPDAVVVDLDLPDGDGVDVISMLSQQSARLPILVLTATNAEDRILSALRVGARGYLFKKDIDRVRVALDDLMRGESPMSASVARLVVAQLRVPIGPYPEAHRGALTPRELEVVEGMRHGLTYEEVGESLGVTTNTIRTYVRSVYEKLEVSSKTEAVLEVLRRGWLV